ncbi:diguanylate cyclase domain-containing protein [Methylomagnum sp.]
MNMNAAPATQLLLVDDDRIDRLACRRALEQSGYDFAVVEAETAEDGLRLVRQQRFDCIVLDHYLPDFNGLEFLTDLGEAGDELPVPVVMLTCANDASVAVRALKLGASDYVVKDLARNSLEWVPAIILKTLRDRRAKQAQREAEEQRRKAEAKFRALVEQIPAVTYIASLESPGKLLYVSPQAASLGHPPEAWLDNPEGLLRWIHPDDRQAVIEHFAETYELHAPLRCEYRLVGADGQAHWFLDEANVVRGEDGRSLFLQGVLVDISRDKAQQEELRYYRRRLEKLVTKRTRQLEQQSKLLQLANAQMEAELAERKQAEAALRASEWRFRSLLESAGEGIFGLDREGRCAFANHAAAALFGYLPESLEGRDMLTILRTHRMDGESASSENPLYRTLFQGMPSRYTETMRRFDGSSFAAEFSAQPILSDVGGMGAVVVVRDVSEAHALTQKLSYEASHDALTGLLNRVEFERRVSKVLTEARENRSEHALCFLDLDRFKAVNDTCGHAAGDQLLQMLGRLMEGRLRQSDTLARLGGDEFGLLLEHCPIEQAWVIANELREAIHAFRFPWGDQEFSVGVSVGLVTLNAASDDVASALRSADTACYVAKKRGRDRVHVTEHPAAPIFIIDPAATTPVAGKKPERPGVEPPSRPVARTGTLLANA